MEEIKPNKSTLKYTLIVAGCCIVIALVVILIDVHMVFLHKVYKNHTTPHHCATTHVHTQTPLPGLSTEPKEK